MGLNHLPHSLVVVVLLLLLTADASRFVEASQKSVMAVENSKTVSNAGPVEALRLQPRRPPLLSLIEGCVSRKLRPHVLREPAFP